MREDAQMRMSVRRPTGRVLELETREDGVYVSGKCDVTGEPHVIGPLRQEDVSEYLTGRRMVQSIFPTLDANAREFLISGFTPKMWAKMFGEDDQQRRTSVSEIKKPDDVSGDGPYDDLFEDGEEDAQVDDDDEEEEDDEDDAEDEEHEEHEDEDDDDDE